MSVNTTPNAKRSTTSDIDSLLPLLFAANSIATLNYKKMSEMDPQGRTASALEHKFRKWRQAGKQILETYPVEAGGPSNTSKASVAHLRGGLDLKGVNGALKRTAQQSEYSGDDDYDEGEAINGAVKAEVETNEKGSIPQTPKAKVKARTTTSKKRAVIEEAGSPQGDESPSKRAKVNKKGTAQVVKKPRAKKASPMSDDFEDGTEEDEGKGKKGNSKQKAAVAEVKKGVAKNKKGGKVNVEETPLVPMTFEP